MTSELHGYGLFQEDCLDIIFRIIFLRTKRELQFIWFVKPIIKKRSTSLAKTYL